MASRDIRRTLRHRVTYGGPGGPGNRCSCPLRPRGITPAAIAAAYVQQRSTSIRSAREVRFRASLTGPPAAMAAFISARTALRMASTNSFTLGLLASLKAVLFTCQPCHRPLRCLINVRTLTTEKRTDMKGDMSAPSTKQMALARRQTKHVLGRASSSSLLCRRSTTILSNLSRGHDRRPLAITKRLIT